MFQEIRTMPWIFTAVLLSEQLTEAKAVTVQIYQQVYVVTYPSPTPFEAFFTISSRGFATALREVLKRSLCCALPS